MITGRPYLVDENAPTGTSTTLSNVLQLRDLRSFLHFCTQHLSLNTTGTSTTWSEKKRAATVGSRLSPTLSAHYGTCTHDHLINVLQLENLRTRDPGNLHLRRDRGVDDINTKTAHLPLHINRQVNQVQELYPNAPVVATTGMSPPCPRTGRSHVNLHTRDIDHHVEEEQHETQHNTARRAATTPP